MIFEYDIDKVKANYHAKYFGQRFNSHLFSDKHRHTSDRLYLDHEVIGNNKDMITF